MSFFKKGRLVLMAGLVSTALIAAQPAAASLFDRLFGNKNYTKTKYPIVLVHGFSGFDQLFGVVDYFYRVPEALSKDGAKVFVAQVSAANSTEVRGEQLLAQIEEIVAVTGAKKVNIIGHSHGSPTARYVAGVRPDLVASVSSVGGANWGSEVADVVGMMDQVSDGAVQLIGNAFFKFLDVISTGGLPQDVDASVRSLTVAGSVAFNREFPDGVPSTRCGNDGAHEANGIRYYSWGGNALRTNIFDPSDVILSITSLAFTDANDGLASTCSQKLGKIISLDHNHNHLDQMNHVLGLKSRNAADPVDLYRQQANRLKNVGL